jgi:hypothetical protein
MTVGGLLKALESFAKKYRLDAIDSVNRNKHMNDLTDENINQQIVDAILVDFINFIAGEYGGDLGLYTHYLKEEEDDHF